MIRPPKPVPFGTTEISPGTAASEIRTQDDTTSRQSLRHALHQRRSSLTPQEHRFLEELIVHGNQVEVQIATTNLCDKALFDSDEMSDDGWKTLELGPEVSQTAVDSKPTSYRSSSSTNSSSKRRLSLQLRRDSHRQVFSDIWKAHDRGLDLSRRSGNIFRQRRSSTTSVSPQGPALRRLESAKSTGGRSVSFGRLPRYQRMSSQSSLPSIHPAVPLRSDSLSSISSLHHAAPLRSESMSSIPSIRRGATLRGDSLSSIASLRPGAPLRGDSMSSLADPASPRSSSNASFPSIHHAHPVRSESSSSIFVSADGGDDNSSIWVRVVEEPEPPRPQLVTREASANLYQGQGVEVADAAMILQRLTTGDIASTGGAASFDDSVSFDRLSKIFRQDGGLRSLSWNDSASSSIFLGGAKSLLRESSTSGARPDGVTSWDEDTQDYYDPWKVLEDEYVNGYGGGGTFDFRILGTSAEDVQAHPHVLSPPLMESLQEFMPLGVQGQNMWMKYSLVRDGASFFSFLRFARGARYTVLAVETVDGECFGAFVGAPWRKNWNYFGSTESFLWRMCHSRKEKARSIIDQAQRESEIEVFPYTDENQSIQLCTHDMLAIGGGHPDPSEKKSDENRVHINDHEWGFGLTLRDDLLSGTSSPCLTFGSPSLSKEHSDGSTFEVMNVELWTLTPCMSLQDAEKLELGKLFLEQQRHVVRE